MNKHQLFVEKFWAQPVRTPSLYKGFRNFLKSKGFQEIGEGDFRQVYYRDKVVVKIPGNKDGLLDNLMEGLAWRKYKNKPTNLGIVLAPCRLLSNQALMMVKVSSYLNLQGYDVLPDPDWVDLLDNRQAAHYKGKVVAYDYALSLTERLKWEQELAIFDSFFQDRWLPDHPELQEEEEDNAYYQDQSFSYG